MATKINLQAPKGKKQTNKQASEGNYVVVEEELEQKKKKAHQMTIQVIRSIAELFKWSCIASNLKLGISDTNSLSRNIYIYIHETHEITGHTQLLIQALHPPTNLHILPNSIIQVPQTRLSPKQFRNI